MTAVAPPPRPPLEDLEALIEEARRRARRRRLVVAGAIVTIFAATALIVGLVLGLRGGNGTAVPRGYHVVQAKGTVQHALVDQRTPNGPKLVDLKTGEVRPLHTQLEVWWDSKSGLVRVVGRLAGAVEFDVVGQRCQQSVGTPSFRFCNAPPPFGLAQLGFRLPVQPNRSRIAARGVVGGRRVVWVETMSPTDGSDRPVPTGEQAALAVRTHEPLAHREYFRLEGRRWVGLAERYRRLPDLRPNRVRFLVPDGGAIQRAYPPAGAEVIRATRTPLREAVGVLPHPPLWLGPRYDGHRLRGVKVGTEGEASDHGPRFGTVPFVLLDYGAITLREYGQGPYWLEHGPPAGNLVIGYGEAILRRNGVLVVAQSRALARSPRRAIALAKALRPVRG